MTPGARGFVPVLHAATDARADEVDTLNAAHAVDAALQAIGFESEIVGFGLDLRQLDGLAARRPLAVFNLVDAVGGDGKLAPTVPARLDALGLTYTGCGARAWIETLSKVGTKLKLTRAGLPTPIWSEDGSGLDVGARVIVKPVFEHGSLGLDETSVVAAAEAAQAILARNARWGTEHFAETFIEGREFNLALLERPGYVEVLPIAEIVFEGFGADRPRIVGYDAKWTPQSAAYRGTPRRFGLENEARTLAAELKRLALACWDLFALRGYARVDFRVDSEDQPSILEVNMNPCLTPDAGFAATAYQAGLSYEDLILTIVDASLDGLKATA